MEKRIIENISVEGLSQQEIIKKFCVSKAKASRAYHKGFISLGGYHTVKVRNVDRKNIEKLVEIEKFLKLFSSTEKIKFYEGFIGNKETFANYARLKALNPADIFAKIEWVKNMRIIKFAKGATKKQKIPSFDVRRYSQIAVKMSDFADEYFGDKIDSLDSLQLMIVVLTRPISVKIVRYLSHLKSPIKSGDLYEKIKLTQTSTSSGLQNLLMFDLVIKKEEGRFSFYQIHEENFQKILNLHQDLFGYK